jgi:hypothetical protein
MKKEDVLIIGAAAVVGVAVIYSAWKQSQKAPPKKPPEKAGAVGGLGIAARLAGRLRIQPGAATTGEKKQIQAAIMAASDYGGEMMAAAQAAGAKTADEMRILEITAASKGALEAERIAAKAEAAAAVATPDEKWAAEETAKTIRMIAEAKQAAALGLIYAE